MRFKVDFIKRSCFQRSTGLAGFVLQQQLLHNFENTTLNDELTRSDPKQASLPRSAQTIHVQTP